MSIVDEIEKARKEKKSAERWIMANVLALILAILLCIILAILSGCALEENMSIIRENVQKIQINVDALAQTIADPIIQSSRKESLAQIQPAESGFPWQEIFGGLISALLLAITGVQIKKYGSVKKMISQVSKKDVAE